MPVTKAYTYMDLSNLSSVSNVYAGGNQMNAISGASSYVPSTASAIDPAVRQKRSDIKPSSQDFQAVGSFLNSDDLSGERQAFAAFRQDIKSAGRAARANQDLTVNTGAPTNAGTTITSSLSPGSG